VVLSSFGRNFPSRGFLFFNGLPYGDGALSVLALFLKTPFLVPCQSWSC